MRFYGNQKSNTRKTWFMMTIAFLIVIAIGFLFSLYYNNTSILIGAVTFSFLMNIGAYWFSDSLVLSMANARKVEGRDEYPDLWNTLENLCATAGLPMPKVYIINDPAPNAFATGRNRNHAVVAVTTGLLPLLNKSELEGVLAHELGHIGNRDALVQTIVVVFAGAIALLAEFAFRASLFGDRNDNKNPLLFVFSFLAFILAPIAATIIRLAISREREFLADATSALITKYPEGLASALEKIDNFHQPMKVQQPAIAHLFIADPTGALSERVDEHDKKVSRLAKLFMTHPPVAERIKRLLAKDQTTI
jgi:heat shock protein HtpX